MLEWYKCPLCGQKLLKINRHNNISGVYIKCKRCKQEIEIKNRAVEPM